MNFFLLEYAKLHINIITHTHTCAGLNTYIYKHGLIQTPLPQDCTNENPHCWTDSEMIGTEKALHQHIQAYGMWTHWWAHTYGAGGFCCYTWEEGTVLAFDQTPNHSAQHKEYSLKISYCLGCIIFFPLFEKREYNTAQSILQVLLFCYCRI